MLYTISQAAKQLGISANRLNNWKLNGKLQKIVQDPTGRHLSTDEISQIKTLMTPPKNSQSAMTISKAVGLSRPNVEKLMRQFNIQPVKKNITHQISVNVDYYAQTDVAKFKKQLLAYRQAKNHQISLIPTTDHVFDPLVDYSANQLIKALDPTSRNSTMVIRWVKSRQLIGLYGIDKYGRLFFTPAQVAVLKTRYRKIPASVKYSHQQLAEKLHVSDTYLTTLTNRCQINPIRVLGYRNGFYTQFMAERISQYYYAHRRQL